MRIDSLGISRDTEQGGMAFVAGVKQSDQIKGTNCKLEYCITLLLQMETFCLKFQNLSMHLRFHRCKYKSVGWTKK